jgi:hypothetical protein
VAEAAKKRPRVDPYFEGEPHPVPVTRAWLEDYQRWVAEGCPSREEEAARRVAGVYPGTPFEEWLAKDPAPDLQALVERASRRRAAELGELWIEDPIRQAREAPQQGGYLHVTAEEWAAYDKAMAEWRQRRRMR